VTDEQKKIIVVDDMPDNLSSIRNTMKDMYDIYPCLSAVKMFDLLKHIQADLILLDVEMPEMNGYEAVKKLKSDAQYKDIPVIFLTSLSDHNNEIEGLKLGVVDYIHKPIVFPLLHQRIKTQLSVLEQQRDIKQLLETKIKEVNLMETAKLEAMNASRAKSEFLAHMSREIRSPLNAVIGMINIASEEKDIDGVKVYLEKAGNAAKHVLGIINDILDMSKIEANNFELSDSEFDLRKMIANIVDAAGISAREKHQQITVNIKENVPEFIICDELRLTQVITNLITNAVKFTPDNGKIDLSIEKAEESPHGADGEITLKTEVTDSGIGISPEQQEKIFVSYNQTDGPKEFGSTGLGLAISKRIVEFMKGKICVESEPGKGAKFIFTIKAKEGTGNIFSDELPETSEDFSEYTILAAEDIEINREIMSVLLDKIGVNVDYAENGKEAVSMFKEAPDKYSLILMDVNMPEMNGDEATRIIRAFDFRKAKEIPVIAMTAGVFDEDIKKCFSAGMNDYISKPISPEIVFAKFKQYLGRGVVKNDKIA